MKILLTRQIDMCKLPKFWFLLGQSDVYYISYQIHRKQMKQQSTIKLLSDIQNSQYHYQLRLPEMDEHLLF